MKRLPVFVALACCLCLAGCSFAARLAYNNLDWLVARQIDEYLSMSDQQERMFETAFGQWWRWHRSSQLPRYAAALRAWSEAAADGVSRADIERALADFERFYLDALDHNFTDIAALLATLSQEQAAELLAVLQEDARTYREDAVEAEPARRQRRREKQMRKLLDRVLGRLDDRQEQLIEAWAEDHEDLAPQWLESRLSWRAAFAAVLAGRGQADFAARLRPLFFNPAGYWSDGHADAVVRNQLRQMDMVVAVFELASDRQLAHLRNQLGRLAQICERLAGQDD